MTKLEDPEDGKPKLISAKEDDIAIDRKTQEPKEAEGIDIKLANSPQRSEEDIHQRRADPFIQTGWMKKRKTVKLVRHEWKEY
ncbi:SAM and PH domain protein (Boi1) [Penicillium malachiteum]|uniref:SAM and PH domain protein (Boi1) n=1 Tax=Penicillium malachiteum TaxID=1324776 RepID=A0AAD6HTY3_9EURO|nr:SAM and PH domain protein (Boi1) [Penicillium malachiteum]